VSKWGGKGPVGKDNKGKGGSPQVATKKGATGGGEKKTMFPARVWETNTWKREIQSVGQGGGKLQEGV